MSHLIQDWRPEDPEFWQSTGRKIARRNLWISIPALFLAFVMWQVWSVTILNLPNVGFNFSKDQLFWLAALPALSGSTLRVFYSFMVVANGLRLLPPACCCPLSASALPCKTRLPATALW